VLPLLAALPAAAILLLGLVRGSLPPALGVAGLFLPVAAFGLGSLLVMEDSKQVTFCGSCHVMGPLVESLTTGDDGSLASMHYARGLVPHDTPCYTCHSGYGIWGTVGAKKAGVMHMLHTVMGTYSMPLAMRAPFDIDACLGCHARAPSFRAVEAHQSLDLQKALIAREMSCTGLCHPPAHPESALTGGKPAA